MLGVEALFAAAMDRSGGFDWMRCEWWVLLVDLLVDCMYVYIYVCIRRLVEAWRAESHNNNYCDAISFPQSLSHPRILSHFTGDWIGSKLTLNL